MVWHVIAGIHSVKEVVELMDKTKCKKVLILGYKSFGKGIDFIKNHEQKVFKNLADWSVNLSALFNDGLTVSFDNLAIKQLGVKRFLAKQQWDEFYLGDDGTQSMYVDLVKKEYALSSTSKERFPITGNIRESFQAINKNILC